MSFSITPTAQIDFPDSSWSLSLQKDKELNEIVISLHWRGKAIPTHQVCCGVEEFKLMIDAVGLV